MSRGIVTLRLEADDLDLGSFVKAVTEFGAVVGDIADEILGKGRVTWIVETISRNSPALLETRPVAPDLTDAELDRVPMILRDGLDAITERVVWPEHFTLRTLERLRALGTQARISTVEVGTEDELVQLTPLTVAHIDELLAPVSTMLGSVEGRVESVNIHNSPEFGLYDLLDKRRIRCFFGSRIAPQDISQALGRRVSVYGVIRTRLDGSVSSISAESLEVLPDQAELPDFRQARGIFGSG